MYIYIYFFFNAYNKHLLVKTQEVYPTYRGRGLFCMCLFSSCSLLFVLNFWRFRCSYHRMIDDFDLWFQYSRQRVATRDRPETSLIESFERQMKNSAKKLSASTYLHQHEQPTSAFPVWWQEGRYQWLSAQPAEAVSMFSWLRIAHGMVSSPPPFS